MGNLDALNLAQFDLSHLNPALLLIVVSLASAAIPLAILSLSSFIKLNIVFSILRNAIGGQNIPPASLVLVLSLVLTLQIMAPVWLDIGANLTRLTSTTNEPMKNETAQLTPSVKKRGVKVVQTERTSAVTVAQVVDAIHPLKRFLEQNSNSRERRYFAHLRAARDKTAEISGAPEQEESTRSQATEASSAKPTDEDPNTAIETIKGEDFFTLIPAFVLTEVGEAFAIGFVMYLPFLIIDLVVANILLSLGMMMINPATISLPAKLILFVLCEGWLHLIQGLIQGYRL